MTKTKTAYQKEVNHLFGLQKYGIKFGLSKTSNLLKAFGNPHMGKKYIHVGGTNGKGSVAAFIASVLKQSGLRVGLYSSPHLVRFTERFKINDREISREKTVALIRELRDAYVLDEPPTFFEATTAMALVYFAREDVDIAIMEVGMGGRLDATNVITPLVAVITNISMEHQFFLGSRLLDIAGEKAGIMKEGVVAITGVSQPSVINLFESIAAEKGVPMRRVGKSIRYRTTETGLHYYGLRRRANGLMPGLKGKFQVRNSVLALAAIEVLEEKGFRISSRDIQEGLSKTAWPGRMQVVGHDPLIILDGAHNPSAVRALAGTIRSEFAFSRLILVIGIMEDKSISQLLKGIVPHADYVIYSRPVYSRAADPEVLAAKASRFAIPGEVAPVLTEALDRAGRLAAPDDMILVCGSLFTVGEAMSYYYPETCKPDDL